MGLIFFYPISMRHYDTLTETINELGKLGYSDQFKAIENGIVSMETKNLYEPNDLEITGIYRFEGETNPSDASEVLVIESEDGQKGTLVLSYGAKNDQETDLIREIPVVR